MKDPHKTAAEFFGPSKPLRLLVVSEDYLEAATMIAEGFRKRMVDMEVVLIHDEFMLAYDKIEEAAMAVSLNLGMGLEQARKSIQHLYIVGANKETMTLSEALNKTLKEEAAKYVVKVVEDVQQKHPHGKAQWWEEEHRYRPRGARKKKR